MSVEPTAGERAAALPGDAVVPDPDVVMDRGFDLPAPPDVVWPWLDGTVGEAVDRLTVAGMAAGLSERLPDQ